MWIIYPQSLSVYKSRKKVWFGTSQQKYPASTPPQLLRCSESGSEQEFGWKGESITRQDGFGVSSVRKWDAGSLYTFPVFLIHSAACVPVWKQKWSTARACSCTIFLRAIASSSPLNTSIIVITRPRGPSHDSHWILCLWKLSECYLLCPTETEISLRLKTKVNIYPVSLLPLLPLIAAVSFSFHHLAEHMLGYMCLHCCFYTLITLGASSPAPFLIFKSQASPSIIPHCCGFPSFIYASAPFSLLTVWPPWFPYHLPQRAAGIMHSHTLTGVPSFPVFTYAHQNSELNLLC